MIVVDNDKLENPDYLVMADDGTGSSVTIPSMLISYNNGLVLKAAIHQQEELLDEMGERLYHHDNDT